MTALHVLFIGAVITIGSIENSFKCMSNRTYHWIQDYEPHHFARRCVLMYSLARVSRIIDPVSRLLARVSRLLACARVKT